MAVTAGLNYLPGWPQLPAGAGLNYLPGPASTTCRGPGGRDSAGVGPGDQDSRQA